MVFFILLLILTIYLYKKTKLNNYIIVSAFIVIFSGQVLITVLSYIDTNLFHSPMDVELTIKEYELKDVDISYIQVDGVDKLIKEIKTKDGIIKGGLSDKTSITSLFGNEKDIIKIIEYNCIIKNNIMKLFLLDNGKPKINKNFEILKSFN